MLTECPHCGTPFDQEEDRIINDECFQCGWATPSRQASHNLNAATLQYPIQVEALAQVIYETQRAYDAACGYFTKPEAWPELDDERKEAYRDRATRALTSRVTAMRTRLIEVRERERAKDRMRVEHPLWEPGEVSDEEIEEEAAELYRTEQSIRVEDGDQSGFLPWVDITRSVRDMYRKRAARALRAKRGQQRQAEEV